MALITNSLYITNSNYTYEIDWEKYCWWDSDIFDIQRKKADIMNIMLWYINNSKDFNKKWLVAIFEEHSLNNEDINFFRIYKWKDWWTYDDYVNSNRSIWFWSIQNRVINL